MKFALIGEGRPAFKVATHIANLGALSAMFTNDYGSPRAIELSQQRAVVIRPTKELFVNALNKCNFTWLLSVNSTYIIPQPIIEVLHGNVLNLHNGPLPTYAGRHVTQWGIRNGEKRFASVVHFVDSTLDTGDIIAETWFDIRDNDTGLSVYERSFKLGANLMISVIDDLYVGSSLNRKPQVLENRHLYRHKDALDGSILWSWRAQEILDFIRAGNYRPLKSPTYTAETWHQTRKLLVYRAEHVEIENGVRAVPGTCLYIDDKGPVVRCGDGAIQLVDVYDGSTKMTRAHWQSLFSSEHFLFSQRPCEFG
jgi:methionyl-tRNA formyltransferase